jgi:hypothetical protein
MNETLYKWISSVNRNVKRGLGTQGQVDELWVDSAKVTNLADPAATRKSAIQAAKERGCEYNSSIQGTVFYYTMPWHNYPQNYEKSFQTEKWAKLWHQRMLVRVCVWMWMWVSVRENVLACCRVCMHLWREVIVFVLWLFNGDFARDGQAKKWGDSVKNTT